MYMKKMLLNYLMLALLSLTFSFSASAQCNNTSAFGTYTANNVLNTPQTLSTCHYLTEYSTVNSLNVGGLYEFTITSNGYITVRSGTPGGPVVAHGPSPLTVVATAATLYVHWNVDAACATAFNCETGTLNYLAPPASCIQPISLSASAITATAATLTWSDANATPAPDYDVYNALAFSPAPVASTVPTVSTTTTTANLTGLMPATQYDYYVRGRCSATDTSAWSGPFTYTTLATCIEPSALTATNITSSSADLGWTENNSATTWELEIGLQGFTQTGNPTFPATMSNPYTLAGLPSNTCFDYYVRSVCSASDTSIWAGPFTFCTSLGCDTVYNVTLSNITSSSVDIAWLDSNSPAPTGWDIEIVAAGATPTGSGVAVTSSPYTAMGLSSLTDYDVYIRTNCGAAGLSPGAGPFSFTTLLAPLNCTAGVPTILLSESFDYTPTTSANTYPAGWSNTGGTGNRTWLAESNQPSSGTGTGPSGGVSGANSGYVYFESSSGTPLSDTLVSPSINLTAVSGNARVLFYYHMHGASMGNMRLLVDDGTTVTDVWSRTGPQQTAATDPWIQTSVNLASYIGSTITLRFVANYGTSFFGDAALDEVLVEGCLPQLIDMSADSITAPMDTVGCYTNAETIDVKITNQALSSIDFSADSVIVTVNVTGATTQTLVDTVTSGTLASGASQIVSMTNTVDMTTVGTYNIIAYTTTIGDVDITNDTIAVAAVYNAGIGTISAAASPTEICLSGTSTITYTGSGGVAIQWQEATSATGPWTNAGTGGTTYTTPTITSTMYYRALATCNGATDSTNVDTVTVYNPIVAATPLNDTICGAGNATLVATGTDTNTQISWYDVPTGGTSLFTGDTLITPTVSTTDTFYAEPQALGTFACSGTRVAVIVVSNPATPITASADTTVCWDGSVAVPLTVTSTNTTYTYSWSPATGLDMTTGDSVNANPLVPTQYVVIGQDPTGCGNTDTINITVQPEFYTVASANPAYICNADTVTLTGMDSIPPLPYCASGATSTADTKIDTVGINGTVTGTAGIPGPSEQYTDNTAIVVPVTAGTSFPIAITKGSASTSTYGAWTKVFIDLDQNGVFDAAEEFTSAAAGGFASGNFTVFDTITIPITALNGPTRMRVVLQEGGSATATTPCGTFTWGETEDYTVDISGATPPFMPTYTYTWMPGMLSGPTQVVTPAATTTYLLSQTDGFGCVATDSVEVAVGTVSGILAQATATNTTSTTGSANQMYPQGDGTMVSYYDPSCNLIATVDDGAGGNVLGNTMSEVTVDPTVQVYQGQPYVRRWYEITPDSDGPADVTLYFTDADFADYNTASGAFDTIATNAGGNTTATICITQVSGGTLGTGTSTVHGPLTATWDAVNLRWETTFPVTGFSEFYCHTCNPLNSALAVSLTEFGVTKEGSVSLASWITESEQNNSHFNVQRSLDGNEFTTLGTVNTKAVDGNSNGTLNYDFTDVRPAVGHNYYRLQMVDQAGKQTYSQIVDIVWGADGSVVTIYPNPATDKLNVDVSIDKVAQIEVRLLDMSGRVIKSVVQQSAKGMNNVSINLSDIATGVYGVQILENNNLIHSSKVNKRDR